MNNDVSFLLGDRMQQFDAEYRTRQAEYSVPHSISEFESASDKWVRQNLRRDNPVFVEFGNRNPEARNQLSQNLNQVEKFIVDAGVKCTAELLDGEKKMNLGDFVFEYQKKFNADLIIIMTKKEELTLSDNISVTARYIINHSTIPVMSIRPKERKYRTGPITAF